MQIFSLRRGSFDRAEVKSNLPRLLGLAGLVATLVACPLISDDQFKDRKDMDGDGYVSTLFGGDDCDDDDDTVNPGVRDVCDDFDNDCDGTLDEDAKVKKWYLDEDGDGYGDIAMLIQSCGAAPPGYVAEPHDCNLGSTEPCDVVSVSVGSNHICALLDTGNLRCWGSAQDGMLGYGNTEGIGDDEQPAAAGDVPVGEGVKQVAAGGATCALLDSGSVKCWGSQRFGVLGSGEGEDIGDNETPASVPDVDVGGKTVELATTSNHVCALLESGGVRCWGYGKDGRLGYGNKHNIGRNGTPAAAGDVEIGAPVTSIALGGSHSCALLDTGAVRCWGDNTQGQLGYGNQKNVGDNEVPSSVGDVPIGGRAVQITAGYSHTCSLMETGAVRCWGSNAYGQLGYGNGKNSIGDNEFPESAGDVPIGGLAVEITAGWYHTCALLRDGLVRCWGYAGNHGEVLGGATGEKRNIGDNEPASASTLVDLGGFAVSISAGAAQTCAVLQAGSLRCWGLAGEYGLGYDHPVSTDPENIGDDETPAEAGDIPVSYPLR